MSNIEKKQYKVFARKYRPETFENLVGQEFLVKTLTNAIKYKKIAHAFILTGVRGVGKTTTARIIAKGINCVGKSGKDEETVNPCSTCTPCIEISNGNHIDVIEMDAASNTGVDDIREIIENSTYKPITSRYKVFIIDEVHMLSKNAFNALLKTLEEPKDNVKFIFATTEIKKVPVTVLSRCQRFDLKRVSISDLILLLKNICAKEKIKFDEDCLKTISRAAEGSVRDALSLLDQANSLCEGNISNRDILEMIGRASNEKVALLLLLFLEGKMTDAIDNYSDLIESGAEPGLILSDSLDLIHLGTIKSINVKNLDVPESLNQHLEKLASLGISRLGRAWQIIMRGYDEIKNAPNIKIAVEMILIRLAYISTMPTPDEIIKKLENETKNIERNEIKFNKEDSSSFKIKSLDDIVSIFEEKGEQILGAKIRRYFKKVKLENGLLLISRTDKISDELLIEISKKLSIYSKTSWEIQMTEKHGDPTLFETEKQLNENKLISIKDSEEVTKVLKAFPDAEITSIKDKDGNQLLEEKHE